jgi:hypothetical protein
MQGEVKPADVEAACKDLRERTLAHIPGDFARLVYLASTRNYNRGDYHHAGLARQFGEDVAHRSLASCHREVFRRLVLCSVTELVSHLEVYVRSTRLAMADFIRAWRRLQPYRVTVPLECSSLTARFFSGNVIAALSILERRQGLSRQSSQSSSRPQ